MRLTEKDYCGYDIKNRKDFNGYDNEEDSQKLFSCLQKLGQLEDIEELCSKVVEKPIYKKYIDTHEIHEEDYTNCCALYSFQNNRIELYHWDFVDYLELDQYGKDWALTREELKR